MSPTLTAGQKALLDLLAELALREDDELQAAQRQAERPNRDEAA